MSDSQQHSVFLRSRWLSMVFFVLLSALTFSIAIEWEHYRRLLSWHQMWLSHWELATIFWLLWSKTILLLFPVLMVGLIFQRLGFHRTAMSLFLIGSGAIFFWLFIDIKVYRLFGNHVLGYLQYLDDTSTLEWSGDLFGPAITGLSIFAGILAIAAIWIWAGVKLWNKLFNRFDWLYGRVTLAFMGIVPVAISLGVIPVLGYVQHPYLFNRLQAVLPVDMVGFFGGMPAVKHSDQFKVRFEQNLLSSYRKVQPTILNPSEIDTTAALPGENLPDVLLIVLESFRHDAVTPDVMKNLHARSQTGIRFDRHYSSSNASQFGLFSLLYGRSPVTYAPTLDQKILPQACETFRQSGYECIHINSATTNWQRMDEFLNNDAFDEVQIFKKGDWPTRDRRALASAGQRLNSQSSQPQFVMLFLMSTHFIYQYPPEYEKFRPTVSGVSPLNGNPSEHREGLWNRYRNSAIFLDAEIEKLLKTIDLRQTLVIVTGDHGESLFEDGTLSHSSQPSEIQTRVPLTMFGASLQSQSIQRATTHVDVLPTLLHAIARKPVPVTNSHGRDMLSGTSEDCALVWQWRHDHHWDLIFLRDQNRMKLDLWFDQPKFRLMGFCDENSHLDFTHHMTGNEGDEWSAALMREFERFLPTESRGSPSEFDKPSMLGKSQKKHSIRR